MLSALGLLRPCSRPAGRQRSRGHREWRSWQESACASLRPTPSPGPYLPPLPPSFSSSLPSSLLPFLPSSLSLNLSLSLFPSLSLSLSLSFSLSLFLSLSLSLSLFLSLILAFSLALTLSIYEASAIRIKHRRHAWCVGKHMKHRQYVQRRQAYETQATRIKHRHQVCMHVISNEILSR